jgi:hypothetical protein
MDGKRSNGEDPQIFSADDLESMNGIDVVYQPVTTNKSSQQDEIPLVQRIVWYAIAACIFSIEAFMMIVLTYRIGSPWIIFVPLSMLLILGVFHLIRTRLDTLKSEALRKVL